jgi:hypothetical protein
MRVWTIHTRARVGVEHEHKLTCVLHIDHGYVYVVVQTDPTFGTSTRTTVGHGAPLHASNQAFVNQLIT